MPIRREYAIPVNLNGAQLARELNAGGVPTDPMQVSVTAGKLVILWRNDLHPDLIDQADAIVARHDWAEAKEKARRRDLVKAKAQALALSLDDPQAIISRAGLRVAYAAIVETRQALQALIGWANTQGARLDPLPPARSWRQVLAAGRQVAASETDPES